MPEKTKVVNVRNAPYDVYIGRPGPFGNPFVVGVHGERGECVKLFRDWLYRHEQHELRVRMYLELSGKTLGCFCKPNACHGDVIVEYVDTCRAIADELRRQQREGVGMREQNLDR